MILFVIKAIIEIITPQLVNKYFPVIFAAILLSGCGSSGSSQTSPPYTPSFVTQTDYSRSDDYDDGYNWAENQDIDNFDDCQNEFGTSLAEDGCNDYVKENYSGYRTFNGYECTEDCGGHEAGYEWAEENDIYDSSDCDGNSSSFNEGCESYVEENY